MFCQVFHKFTRANLYKCCRLKTDFKSPSHYSIFCTTPPLAFFYFTWVSRDQPEPGLEQYVLIININFFSLTEKEFERKTSDLRKKFSWFPSAPYEIWSRNMTVYTNFYNIFIRELLYHNWRKRVINEYIQWQFSIFYQYHVIFFYWQ